LKLVYSFRLYNFNFYFLIAKNKYINITTILYFWSWISHWSIYWFKI